MHVCIGNYILGHPLTVMGLWNGDYIDVHVPLLFQSSKLSLRHLQFLTIDSLSLDGAKIYEYGLEICCSSRS